jgi:hypothetical protein
MAFNTGARCLLDARADVATYQKYPKNNRAALHPDRLASPYDWRYTTPNKFNESTV